MQSRETRFFLRIESGDRMGEQVPLPQGVLRVGRRADSELMLKDASVSGKHAEVRLEGERVEVVDLGSTNGTRVGGDKIESLVVAHGDAILFGNIRVTLHDAQLAGASQAPLAPSLEPEALGESAALRRLSADEITRSRAGSKRPFLLVVLLLGVLGGGAFAYLKFGRSGDAPGKKREIPTVPGNLLADGSFEEGTADWTAAEAAPEAFLLESGFARSGDVGLGASFDEAGWSLAKSAEITLHARKSIVFAGALRVDGAAMGRIGIELSSVAQGLKSFIAWAPARKANGEFEEFEHAFDVPGGYDRGRMVVAGAGQGTVALDDVSALEKESLGTSANFTEYELGVLGIPGSCAVIVRSGRTLIAGLDLSSWGRSAPAGWAEAALRAEAGPRGFTLSFAGAPRDASLGFFALRPDDAPEGEGGWVATTGVDGYTSYGGDFEKAGVSDLLLGSGSELLRVGFAGPAQVAGERIDGGMAFRVKLGGLDFCEFQLSFGEERVEAATLADRALESERRKDLGQALAAWTELLDRFPFERRLVNQATESRARLIQDGLSHVDSLRREMERARFFLLPELFEMGAAQAQGLAHQYAGSEVEEEAKKVAATCRMALTELTAGAHSGEARRLQGVLEALDPAESPRLAELVRGVLQEVNEGSASGGSAPTQGGE